MRSNYGNERNCLEIEYLNVCDDQCTTIIFQRTKFTPDHLLVIVTERRHNDFCDDLYMTMFLVMPPFIP